MYRSGSSSRVSDELFSNTSNNTSDSDTEEHHVLLPTYNNASSVKKEKFHRLRSAETAVHVIPLLLILCAVILWFCSTPGFRYLLTLTTFNILHMAVNMGSRGDSITLRMRI